MEGISFSVVTGQLPEDGHYIRETVFIKEQGFSNEFDDIDQTATHILCYSNEQLCGYARIYPDAVDKTYHLGRLCVLKAFRKMKLGTVIMKKAEELALQMGATTMVLSAQETAVPFYRKLSYVTEGEKYFDEWCPHIKMIKHLSQ